MRVFLSMRQNVAVGVWRHFLSRLSDKGSGDYEGSFVDASGSCMGQPL